MLNVPVQARLLTQWLRTLREGVARGQGQGDCQWACFIARCGALVAVLLSWLKQRKKGSRLLSIEIFGAAGEHEQVDASCRGERGRSSVGAQTTAQTTAFSAERSKRIRLKDGLVTQPQSGTKRRSKAIFFNTSCVFW